MTDMERVWNRLKSEAAKNADRGYRPALREAIVSVVAICRDELPTYPPDEAIEFLASELVRMSREAYETRSPRLRRNRFEHGLI